MIRFFLRDKTPREKEPYTIDWTKYLPQGATLTGIPLMAVEEGTVVPADGVNNTGSNKTSFTLDGGAVGEVARVRIGVDLDDGNRLDAHCILGVR